MIYRDDSKQVSQKVRIFEGNLALEKALQDKSSNQIIYWAYCHSATTIRNNNSGTNFPKAHPNF